MNKKIIILSLAIAQFFIINTFSQKLNLDLMTLERILLDEKKQIEVNKEGLLFSFSPMEQASYKVSWIVNNKTNNDSFIKQEYDLKIDIYDENKELIATNKGNKYDIYDNSYNQGQTVAGGEGGGEVEDVENIIYYNNIKFNAYSGETYYIVINIPSKQIPNVLEDGEYFRRDDAGNLVKVDPKDLELVVNGKVTINNNGALLDKESLNKSKNAKEEGSLFSWILKIIGILLIAIIVLVKFKKKTGKISKKEISEVKELNTDMIYCSKCGMKNEKNSNFCKYCGKPLKK